MPKPKEAGEQIPAEFGNPAEAAPDVMPEERGGPEGPAGEAPPPETPAAGGEQELLAIEEHAAKLKVSKPIVAAIMQAEGWAEGKKVTKTAFLAANDAFLNGPMGGKKEPPKAGEQRPPEGDKS
jgi:hypothetical protein